MLTLLVITAEPLTEEDNAEKESLLDQGFAEWSKKDFTAFVKACERFGRDKLADIAGDVEGKTLDEVKKYSKVFWARYQEIADHEKIIAAIERGEAKLQRKQEIQDILTAKVNSCKNPQQQLKLSYGQNKGKFYTEEEDRFMVRPFCFFFFPPLPCLFTTTVFSVQICALKKHGYGEDESYEKIRQDARVSPLFRFDWYLKSRTAVVCLLLLLLFFPPPNQTQPK